MESTLKNPLSPAEICRRNGWGPGTRLIGEDDYDTCTIEITAIGIEKILARCIEPHGGGETGWSLDSREWKKVEPHA